MTDDETSHSFQQMINAIDLDLTIVTLVMPLLQVPNKSQVHASVC
jgi:hypothetical protein